MADIRERAKEALRQPVAIAGRLSLPRWLLAVGRYGLGTGLTALFIWWLLRGLDFSEIWPALRGANPVYLVAIFPLYLGRFVLRALRFKMLISHLRAVEFRAVLPRTTIGQAANMVLPFQLGYGLTVQLSAERFRIGRTQLLGATAIERMMDGLTFALFLGVAMLTLSIGAGFSALAIFLLFGTCTGLGLAWWASRPSPPGEAARAGWTGKVWRLHSTLVEPFFAGMRVIRNLRQVIAIFLVSIAIWSLEATLFWMIGLAVGLDVNILVYFFLTAAAHTGAGIPVVVSGVGFIFVGQQALLALGEDPELATAYLLALEGVLIVPMVVIGPLAAWLLRLRIRDVFSTRRVDQEAPHTTEVPAQSR